MDKLLYSHKSNLRLLRICVIGLLAMFLPVILLMVITCWSNYAKMPEYTGTVDATVLSCEGHEEYDFTLESYYTVYESVLCYQVDGETYFLERDKKSTVGDTTVLRYRPEDPQDAVTQWDWKTQSNPAMLVMPVLSGLTILAFYLILFRNPTKQWVRLSRELPGNSGPMYLAYMPLSGRQGHAMAWKLLAELYRKKAGAVLPDVKTTPRGKPYIENSPWHFSISHTPLHAFVVLARENVAIDAEELDRETNLRLAEKVLSPSEKARFDEAEDKRRALLTFWVLKEAEAKLTGEGLKGYPDHTAFSLEDSRVQEIDGCIVAVLTEEK